MTNKYFFLNDLTDADSIFGDQQPTCLDEAEVRRLSDEWERDLFDLMHEASDEEIAQWGTYNTTTEDDEPEEAVPYEVVESVSRGGQIIETTTPFCDADKAVAFAKAQWDRMCDADKREATVYALECANPDPEAPDHFDGNTLWSSDEVGSLRLQFEATPDGNTLSGENDSLSIRCTIEVPEGASDDYGYLTMKEAILSKLTDAEKEAVTFWYDGQEQCLEEDASADADVNLDIERF